MSKTLSPEKKLQILYFMIKGNKFAIPVNFVYEVVNPKDLRFMSGAPGVKNKVINYKGENIPVFEAEKFFRLETETFCRIEFQQNDEQFILILQLNRQKIGIFIDIIFDVREFDAEAKLIDITAIMRSINKKETRLV